MISVAAGKSETFRITSHSTRFLPVRIGEQQEQEEENGKREAFQQSPRA
jgi:hypothetical protein